MKEEDKKKFRKFREDMLRLEKLVAHRQIDNLYENIQRVSTQIERTAMSKELVEELALLLKEQEEITEIIQRQIEFYIEHKKFVDFLIKRYRPEEAAKIIRVMETLSDLFQNKLIFFNPAILTTEKRELEELQNYHWKSFRDSMKKIKGIFDNIIISFKPLGQLVPQRSPLTEAAFILMIVFTLVSSTIPRNAAGSVVLDIEPKTGRVTNAIHFNQEIRDAKDFYNIARFMESVLKYMHPATMIRNPEKGLGSINPKKLLKEVQDMIRDIENVKYRQEQEELFRRYLSRLEEIRRMVKSVANERGFLIPTVFPERPSKPVHIKGPEPPPPPPEKKDKITGPEIRNVNKSPERIVPDHAVLQDSFKEFLKEGRIKPPTVQKPYQPILRKMTHPHHGGRRIHGAGISYVR